MKKLFIFILFYDLSVMAMYNPANPVFLVPDDQLSGDEIEDVWERRYQNYVANLGIYVLSLKTTDTPLTASEDRNSILL